MFTVINREVHQTLKFEKLEPAFCSILFSINQLSEIVVDTDS